MREGGEWSFVKKRARAESAALAFERASRMSGRLVKRDGARCARLTMCRLWARCPVAPLRSKLPQTICMRVIVVQGAVPVGADADRRPWLRGCCRARGPDPWRGINEDGAGRAFALRATPRPQARDQEARRASCLWLWFADEGPMFSRTNRDVVSFNSEASADRDWTAAFVSSAIAAFCWVT
jgi:hypothetical protein